MIGAHAEEAWFAQCERDLARTTRRDETALAARIAVLEDRLAAIEALIGEPVFIINPSPDEEPTSGPVTTQDVTNAGLT